MIGTLTALAAENPQTMTEKAMYALENSLLGILITFSVLVVLCLVVKIAANILRGKKENKTSNDSPVAPAPAPAPHSAPTPVATADNGELIAAITAAISLMLEAEGKDPRGFRVVSFRRSSQRK